VTPKPEQRTAEGYIAFKLERRVAIDSLWYDPIWHQEMLDDGWTEEGALTEMLRQGWIEDWTSLVQNIFESDESYADTFINSLSEIHLVDENGRPL
jgi:hypothetical protein